MSTLEGPQLSLDTILPATPPVFLPWLERKADLGRGFNSEFKLAERIIIIKKRNTTDLP